MDDDISEQIDRACDAALDLIPAFVKKVHLIFEKNEWKWVLVEGGKHCVPSQQEIEANLRGLVFWARDEAKKSNNPWMTTSSGRLQVRLTHFHDRVSAHLELVPEHMST